MREHGLIRYFMRQGQIRLDRCFGEFGHFSGDVPFPDLLYKI